MNDFCGSILYSSIATLVTTGLIALCSLVFNTLFFKKFDKVSQGVAEYFGKNPDMDEDELESLVKSQAKKFNIKVFNKKQMSHIIELAHCKILDCNYLHDNQKNSIVRNYVALKNHYEEIHLKDKDYLNVKKLNPVYLSVMPFIVGIAIGVIGLSVYGILHPPKAIQLFSAIILTMVINTVIVAFMIKKS